jgi:hypothetical protein
MTLPVTVVIDRTYFEHEFRAEVSAWIKENITDGSITTYYYRMSFVFEHEEDAVAFMLRFGARRQLTALDKMLKSL